MGSLDHSALSRDELRLLESISIEGRETRRELPPLFYWNRAIAHLRSRRLVSAYYDHRVRFCYLLTERGRLIASVGWLFRSMVGWATGTFPRRLTPNQMYVLVRAAAVGRVTTSPRFRASLWNEAVKSLLRARYLEELDRKHSYRLTSYGEALMVGALPFMLASMASRLTEGRDG